VVDQFYQREPHPGQAVSEKTEFLIAYDHDKLYFAFQMLREGSGNITAKEMARDVSLGEDDRVQVILDTFLDGRNGYCFRSARAIHRRWTAQRQRRDVE